MFDFRNKTITDLHNEIAKKTGNTCRGYVIKNVSDLKKIEGRYGFNVHLEEKRGDFICTLYENFYVLNSDKDKKMTTPPVSYINPQLIELNREEIQKILNE